MDARTTHPRHDGPARPHEAGYAAGFFVGLVAALVVGWWAFPTVLYSQKVQPVHFSHATHVEESGMACEDCHFYREDGTYNGLPTTEKCAECHADALTEDPREIAFVEDYVYQEKDVDWLVYQYQPDNVFFSHAAHKLDNCNMCHGFEEREHCSMCHLDVGGMDGTPVYNENRLTGYSKDTMKMQVCEHCHAHPDHTDGMTRANNACYTCHK